MKILAKIVHGFIYIRKIIQSQMLDRVLNTPLVIIDVIFCNSLYHLKRSYMNNHDPRNFQVP